MLIHHWFASRMRACCAGACVPAVLTAQVADTTRATTLPPLTVTAAVRRAATPPVVTIVVDSGRLNRTQGANPYDFMRRAAGLEIHEQGQGPGFASDAVIRGFTSDHSSDVLLVIDGVPVNLPMHGHVEGYADWSVLLPAALRELRVIHGPASPLYGDFAFGGVVEAFTNADASGTDVAIDGSSIGDVGGWLRTGVRAVDGGMLLAVDGRAHDGWRDNSEYRLGNGLLRGWRGAGRGRVEGGIAVYGASWNSPGFLSVAQYNAGDLRTATDVTDGGNANRLVIHGRYATVFGQGTGFEVVAWAQHLESNVFLNIAGHGGQSAEQDRRQAGGGHAQLTWRTAGGDATFGVSGRGDAVRYDLAASVAREPQAGELALDADYGALAAYTRWRRAFAGRVALDLGARIEAARYQNLDRLTPAATELSATPVVASPKIGVRYLLNSTTALLASVSRGFRGAPGVITDPRRPLMTTWAREAGVRYDDGSVALHLAAFRLDVANERIQDPVTRAISDAGQSVRQGISAEATVRVAERLEFRASGTYNDAKISGEEPVATAPSVVTGFSVVDAGPLPAPTFHVSPLAPGDPVPGVGRYVGRVEADAASPGENAVRATLRYSGPFTPIGEPGVRTRPYAILDLGATLDLRPLRGRVDVELQNLFNARYPEIRASNFINPGAPRTLRVLFRWGVIPATSTN